MAYRHLKLISLFNSHHFSCLRHYIPTLPKGFPLSSLWNDMFCTGDFLASVVYPFGISKTYSVTFLLTAYSIVPFWFNKWRFSLLHRFGLSQKVLQFLRNLNLSSKTLLHPYIEISYLCLYIWPGHGNVNNSENATFEALVFQPINFFPPPGPHNYLSSATTQYTPSIFLCINQVMPIIFTPVRQVVISQNISHKSHCL